MQPSSYLKPTRLGQAVGKYSAIVALAASFQANVCQSAATPDVTIAEIRSQWKERENKITSLRLEWRESRFYRKAALSDGSPFSQAGAPEPAADTVVDFSRSLLCDHGRIRLVDDGKYLAPTSSGNRDYLDAGITWAWNRSESRSLMRLQDKFPEGAISSDAHDAYQDGQFRPPVIACWPLTAPNGIPLESYRVAKTVTLDGDEFLVLEKSRRHVVDDAELWLQTRPPFLPVRIIRYTKDRRSSELTIGYAHVPGEEWHPSGWKGIWLADDGGYAMAADATVTSHDFAPTVHDADFTIDFPAGSWIKDRTKPGEPIEYIQRKDGSRRIILEEELRRGARYQDLIETETGQARPRKLPETARSARPWAILLGSVAVGGSAFLIALRKRRLV